jgi:hypothetical protein
MALSFVAKASTSRLPLPAATHRVVVPQWASGLWVGPSAPGHAALARTLGSRLDATPARTEPPGRAWRPAPAAGLSHSHVQTHAQVIAQVAARGAARVAVQVAAPGEAVAQGRPRAGLLGAAWPLLVALRQRMARGAPDGQAVSGDPGPAGPLALARPLLGLIARQFRKIDAWGLVPQERAHDARQAVPAQQPAAAGAAVADPLQRGRLAGMQAAMQQNTQALAGMARALRPPLARMGGGRPAHRPGPDACVPVLATLSDVVADGLYCEGPARRVSSADSSTGPCARPFPRQAGGAPLS